jgi:hypothetical protein
MDRGIWSALPPLMTAAKSRDHSNMEIQMRQTYANAKKILSEFRATLDDVGGGPLRHRHGHSLRRCSASSEGSVWVAKARSGKYDCRNASIGLPTQLIEIKFVAKVR